MVAAMIIAITIVVEIMRTGELSVEFLMEVGVAVSVGVGVGVEVVSGFESVSF